MSLFNNHLNMIFQCDGGPGGGSGRRNSNQEQDDDESYSEEDEEASSTSVESEEGEDEEEEEEEEMGESEEDSEVSSEDGDELAEEEVSKRKPARNIVQNNTSSTSTKLKLEPHQQRGRVTRQKAREEMPTKRLLRSRKKSPAAGKGPRVAQVFKCPNCKKEFNNKVSLSRHTGWCKQKASSPRKKKKSEDGGDGTVKITPTMKNKEEKIRSQSRTPKAQVTEEQTPTAPLSAPRRRGRPKKNPVPSESPSSSAPRKKPKSSTSEQHPFRQQQHYQEDMMMVMPMMGGVGVGARPMMPSTSSSVEDDFMQQKSPQSSPGIMDTSSEEDYEQKEFAANAHQLISHRNNSSASSIDVVNPDPGPGRGTGGHIAEGPVTCSQCKMTYRTLLGYQNHIPNCAPCSSDEDDEDNDDEVNVVDHHPHNLVPNFQQPNGPNWAVHDTMSETVIAPPPQPMEVEDSEAEESSASSSEEDASSAPLQVQNVDQQVISDSSHFVQNSPRNYHEINIAATGMGKSPMKIFLPPDNTPQVINASGLTLERLGASPVPKTISPATINGIESHRRTPQSHHEEHHRLTPQLIQLPLPPPPPPVYHSSEASYPSNIVPPPIPPSSNLTISSAVYHPTTQYAHPHPPQSHQVLSHMHPPPQQIAPGPTPSPSPNSSSKTNAQAPSPSPSTSSVSIPINPLVHAGGNPPTYTQAQLMPGTVLHNSIMPGPPQQMSTSTGGDAYHLHQPVSSQSQFAGSHYPICYTTQAAPAPQSTFRVQNSIPGGLLPGPHPGIFIGGGAQSQQLQLQQQMTAAVAQAQMLRHPLPPDQQQRLQQSSTQPTTHFTQQISSVSSQPQNVGGSNQISTSQIPPGQQQHPLFANGVSPYGIPANSQQPTFSLSNGQQQFPQGISQLAANAMSFPQILQQQHPQLPPQLTALNAQQIQQQFAQQQHQQVPGVASATLPNSMAEGTPTQLTPQQFQALQSQHPQQLQQYFQSLQSSNLPKIPDNLGQPSQQVLQQQQSMFNGQQSVPSQPIGITLQQLQQLQQQQRNSSTQLQHPPHLPQSLQQQSATQPQPIFQHQISNPTTGQLPGATAPGAVPNFMQPYNSQTPQQSQSTDNSSSIPGATPPQQQPMAAPNEQQPSNNNLNLQQPQMELNLQQQVQLQQQQQQFIALQQQMQIQQNADPNRPQQSQQFIPQNLQALMANGSLQWAAKPGQAPQQIQVPQPQQQQQQQQATATETVAASSGQQPAQQPQQQTGPAQVPTQVIQAPAQPQQTLPQVIQQLAQVTDSAGNTYIIIAPSQPQQQTVAQNGATTGNSSSTQLLNLLPAGLQGLQCQQQQQQVVQRLSNSSPMAHCSANGVANHHSPSSSGNTFGSMGKSAPCPCATCKEKVGTLPPGMEKYKKVLPYPSANDPPHQPQYKPITPNIAPKPPVSIRPAIPKPPTKVVRVQAATGAATTTRPTTVQLAFQNMGPQHLIMQQQQQQPPGSQLKVSPAQQQAGLIGVTTAGGSAGATPTISNPNIAVVRPMENPLQRLSDQISQIESTFMSAPTPPPMSGTPTPPTAPSSPAIIAHNQYVSTPQHQGPNLTLVTASPAPSPSSSSSSQIPISSISPSSQQVCHVITLEPPPPGVYESPSSHPMEVMDGSVVTLPAPRLTLVDHGTPPIRQPPSSTASPASSPQLSSPGSSIQSISAPSTPSGKTAATTRTARVKRKVLQVSPSSGGQGPEPKTIKLQLHKKENAYSIKNIEENSTKVKGSFKSLKIRGKILKSNITSTQEGTATNVIVVPLIHLQPNPDPDTNEGNITIAEDENSSSSSRGDNPADVNGMISQRGGDNNNNGTRTRLNSYRAVVVWEVRMESNGKVLFKSSDVRDVWDRVFQIAQGTRLNHNLPPISYPATNIALPRNEMRNAAKAMFDDLGLTHKAIEFLLQELQILQRSSKQDESSDKLPLPQSSLPSSLPSSEVDGGDSGPCNSSELTSSEEEPHHQKDKNDGEETSSEELDQGNESGCARFERFTGRKSFDMFGWLTSKHRDPPSECDAAMESLKFLSAPIGMRYRKLKDKAREYLIIKTSEIHGRGLFTKRDIEKGEMIIEYAGEVIRPLVCDMREKYYESKAIGCYMFRINDHVIDATMKGNAARFINHSCEPNCEARAVRISGKDHIIIFSLQRIGRGEELTYDYSFEKEEEKIICTCKSKYCRKYLN